MNKLVRIILKFIAGLLLFLGVVLFGLWITGNGYLIKALALSYGRGYSSASIDDYQFFDCDTIQNGSATQPWKLAENYNQTPLSPELLEAHKKYESIAWLVIQDNQIIQEHYWDFGSINSKSNSFSMSKTIVSLCLFKAIEEGKIKNLNEPVSDFIPSFNEGLAQNLTVGDLSSMSSGLNWEESYSSPFALITKAYYGKHLAQLILNLKVVTPPGEQYNYQSINTALLVMVLEKAVGESISKYTSDHFWKPMGASQNAYWMMDQKGGMVKGYCGFVSNARDFARWGKLALNQGNWDGNQLLDSTWIQKASRPVFKATPYYGYSFWLDNNNQDHVKTYFYRGILGQYIICIPAKNMIIVRLGKKRGKKINNLPHPQDYYIWVHEALKLSKR